LFLEESLPEHILFIPLHLNLFVNSAMLLKNLFCFFLYVFFVAVAVSAQYKISHITTLNGLPSNGIKGLQWDKSTNFLWIATEGGLVRYNGISFKVFDIKTNPDLGSNRLVSMIKNTSDKILIKSEVGSVFEVNNNTVYSLDKNFNAQRDNYKQKSESPIVGSGYNRNKNIAWAYSFLFEHKDAIVVNDSLLLEVEAGKLYKYSPLKKQPVQVHMPGIFIKKLFVIGAKLYCIGNNNRVYSYDNLTEKLLSLTVVDKSGKSFSLQYHSEFFYENGMETPVLLQKGNAYIFTDNEANNLTVSTVATDIPAEVPILHALYESSNKYLFLSTSRNGFYIFHEQAIFSKKPLTSAKADISAAYSQIELPNGNVLTNNGKVSGNDLSQNNYNIGIKFESRVFNLNEQEIIISSNDSFFIYNRKEYTKRLFFAKPYTGPDFGFAYSSGSLYFVDTVGIWKLQNGKLEPVKTFGFKNSGALAPYNIIEASPGKLLLATCYGLYGFDIKTKKLDTILKSTSACMRTLFRTGNYILIGTYGNGYYVYKDGIIKAMPLDNKGFLNNTHCFLLDSNGFVWISTNNGLFKAQLGDITQVFDKAAEDGKTNTSQIYYHYYGADDGMENTELNGGCTPCAIKLRSNNFSFPAMDGLVWVKPLSTWSVLPAGKIFIDALILNGVQQILPFDSIIQLPTNVMQLGFVFTMNAWCKYENIYLQYALDNGKWLPVEFATGEPRINFSGLGYGKHVLKLRKLNGFGFENYYYTQIILNVAVPFYYQWWFRVLMILMLLAIIYLLFRFRLKQYRLREQKISAMIKEKTKDLQFKNEQLEKNDELKTRLISVINHDIITPLKFMNYAGKALIKNKGTISREEQLKTISDITQTTNEMEILSSQILNWIIYQNPSKQMQKEEFDLQQLVNSIFRVLDFPASQKNLKLVNNVPAHFIIFQYMEPVRVLIYNLVMNSINFTKEGVISVDCSGGNDSTDIKVTDTGIGMTSQQISNFQNGERIITSANVDNRKGTGLGYVIIRDLLKIVNGTILLSSEKDKGTTVVISLPASEEM
jgi:signal transduction histidine kinase